MNKKQKQRKVKSTRKAKIIPDKKNKLNEALSGTFIDNDYIEVLMSYADLDEDGVEIESLDI